MKKHFHFVVAALVIAGTTVGCKQKTAGTTALDFATAEKNISAPLTTDSPTPACSIEVSVTYVKGETPVAKRINQSLVNELFGYDALTPQAAVDSFTNSYVKKYQQETGASYLADKEMGGGDAEWYNYTYSLTTQTEDAKEGVLTFSVKVNQFQGGPHGVYNYMCLNFDERSGALLTLDSIFVADYKERLSDILLTALIKEKNVTSLEALKEQGYLPWTDLYPSENFYLGKDTMQFFYNVYEIAPYCEGMTILCVPYTDLKGLLKE